MTDDLPEFVHRIGATLDAVGVPWMVVGSVASSLNGAPRSTQDVDFVARVRPESVDPLLALLPDDQYYIDGDAIREAIRLRRSFNVVDLRSAWKADVIIPKATAFAASEFERRVRARLGPADVWVASVEDTILSKLAWALASGGSERQLRDVAGMVAARRAGLDLAYVDRWAPALGVDDLWQGARPR